MKVFSKIRLFGTDIFVKDIVTEHPKSYDVKYGAHVRDIVRGNEYVNTRSGTTETYGAHSGTDADPYETFDHFFERLNEGETDIRCYIDTPGVYVVHKPVHSNCVVHVTVRANNVKIVLNDTTNEPFVGYNVHWNWSRADGVTNPKISIPKGDRIYFDNSLVTIENFEFDKFVAMYGGSGMFSACKMPQFYADMANVVLYQTHITNTDPSKTGIVIRRASQASVYGATSYSRLSENGTANSVISIERSNADVEFSLDENKGYYHGLRSENSIVNITEARFNNLNSNSVNGNLVTGSLIIKKDATIE